MVLFATYTDSESRESRPSAPRLIVLRDEFPFEQPSEPVAAQGEREDLLREVVSATSTGRRSRRASDVSMISSAW